MCDYCDPKGEKNIHEKRINDYPSKEEYIYLHFNKLRIETYSSDGNNDYLSTEINYCPMCGRKL